MKKRTAFITGIAGFAGSYLAEELLTYGYSVAGSLAPGESTSNLASIEKKLRLVRLDILNPSDCRKAVLKFKPEYLFHLAAIASVGKSFDLEQQTFRVNFEGTTNMLQAAEGCTQVRKFLFVGSCDAYGIVRPATKALTENDPFRPISPYGISKAAAEYAALYYHRRHRVPVVVARAFNHSGPRQAELFVIPSFARQIALIEAGRQEPVVRVGDISVKRDISDVRDIVKGYRLAAENGTPGEVYQFCSGKAVSIKMVLDLMRGLSPLKIAVRVDKERLRKADIPVLRGSHAKATRKLGYRPAIELERTLADTLNYWRLKIPA